MIPNDYEALKKDKEFRYFLKTLKNQKYWLTEITSKSSDLILNDLKREIDKQINTLKDMD